jgi:hypothetical protein
VRVQTSRDLLQGIDPPLAGNSPQFLETAVFESEAGAGLGIPNRARSEHFAGPRERRDARRGMDGDPSHVATAAFDLPEVDSAADLEVQLSDRPADGVGAGERPSRGVEEDEEPVAGGVDLLTTAPADLAAHVLMVALEELAPAMVAEIDRALSGTHDVGEED